MPLRDVFCELTFRHGFGKVKRFFQTDVGRDGLIDQFVNRLDADGLQHGRNVFCRDTNVAVYKFICVHNIVIYDL